MKKIFILGIAILVYHFCFSQTDANNGIVRFLPTAANNSWFYIHHTNSNSIQISHGGAPGTVPMMTISNAGNLGIGTVTPSVNLEVAQSGTAIFRNMNYSVNGKIEGALNIFRNQADPLSVNTVLNLGNYYNSLSSNTSILAIDFRSGDVNGIYGGASNPSGRIKVQTAWEATPYMDFDLNGSTTMRLQNGKVGIGCSAPDAKLTVKGTVHSEEVKVDIMNSICPDYVFEKDYNLLPLSELEAYINANRHLPEVPSAKEMEANGLNLKEMNLILLKKVEELTLHLIEQNKKSEQQERINEEQQKMISQLISNSHEKK